MSQEFGTRYTAKTTWDAIIAVVGMPDEVTLRNWQEFAHACLKDMQILRQIISDCYAEIPTKRPQLAPE